MNYLQQPISIFKLLMICRSETFVKFCSFFYHTLNDRKTGISCDHEYKGVEWTQEQNLRKEEERIGELEEQEENAREREKAENHMKFF